MARTRPSAMAQLFGATRAAGTLAAGTSLGWLLYSRFFVDHERPLPPAIGVERRSIDTDAAGRIGYYVSEKGEGRPLVLIHSVNAAASSYEMMPIFERYHGIRPVFAIDLPGFGISERRDVNYTPDFFAEAIHYALRDIALARAPVDLVALSLSSEFAALAALRTPDLVNSLTLISPTGFATSDEQRQDKRVDATLSALKFPLWSQGIFDALVARPSLQYFLQKSFEGSVDQGLLDYAYESAHQPGARHAPLAFLSGKLFTPEVRERVYARLRLPVAVLFDRDGYTSFEALPDFAAKHSNWRSVRIVGTRGLPHFEQPIETSDALDGFWSSLGARRSGATKPLVRH